MKKELTNQEIEDIKNNEWVILQPQIITMNHILLL